jgi:Transposase and inactivated derivatives
MTASYHRHDISDGVWELIKPHTIGNKGSWGGNAHDTRKFINAVFWILRTGAPWRDLPPDYGNWNTVQRRFSRWRDKGIWEQILEALVEEPDLEWLMIDASHIKVHPHGTGAVGGNQDMGKTKGGSIPRYTWPWMRMVCRSDSLLQLVQQRIARMLES